MSRTLPSPFRLAAALILVWCLGALPVNAGHIPSETPSTPLEEWQPAAGDMFIGDTKENIGYLVHKNGKYTSFPIVTGQHRTVRYIGRTYNAKTPARSWTALSLETKGDHVTFGKTGRFLRLTHNKNEEKTPYGIHSHRSADEMLGIDDRYRSMGCVIVSESILNLLIASFDAGGGRLPVITVYGVTRDLALGPQLLEMIASK